MPSLTRRTKPLLRQVGGKPHASADDHEGGHDTIKGRNNGTAPASASAPAEEDIYAEPASSSDEAGPQQTAPPARMKQPPRKKNNMLDTSIQSAPKRRREQPIRAPKRGSYTMNRSGEVEADKENTSSNSKARADGPIFSGMQYMGPVTKKQKTVGKGVSRTTNIHADLSSKTRAGPRTFSAKGYRPTGLEFHVPQGLACDEDEDSDSDSDSVSLESLDLGMNKRATAVAKKKNSEAPESKKTNAQKPAKADFEALRKHITNKKGQRQHSLPNTRVQKSTRTSSRVFSTRRSNNMASRESSSELSSVPSDLEDHDEAQRELEDLETYAKDNPANNGLDDSICSLCKETVDEEHQREFWKANERTYRKYRQFCKEHKHRVNLAEYHALGYPDIDWDALPSRIGEHKVELAKILKNERRSNYREHHKESLVSGHAAALSTLRKDLLNNLNADREHDITSTRTSTGYYGPRGKRVMMETMTSLLHSDIKATRDPVVVNSSFASFMQLVLVPELTLMLIMDDQGVSRDKANEIASESADLGCKLHEEIDDQVHVEDDDEEEDHS